jgi:large repetitive protein
VESEDMHKQDSKNEIKAKFKRFLKTSYMNVFLVFAAVLIAGVLFSAPTSAQDQQPGFPGELGLPSQDNSFAETGSNQAPSIISLVPDKLSPQEAGVSIKWTVKAEDPENDPISYMFRLKGPAATDKWLPLTQWIQEDTWTWNTASLAAGKYQISLWVRDPMHTSPDFKPNEKIIDYEITPPQAPAVTTQPALVPETNAGQNFPQVNVPVQQPEQVPEQIAPPVVSAPVNLPPTVDGLTSTPASPQVAGATISFMAAASDPENDPLQYMFLLDGQPKTSWAENPSWTWTTAVTDIGSHSI